VNENLNYNIFSVTEMLIKGYKVEGDRNSLELGSKV
jgi:hypothetical protein